MPSQEAATEMHPFNPGPGILLVERVDDCVRVLRRSGLKVAVVPADWGRARPRTDDALSKRERAVLRFIVKGYSYEAISKELEISERTVGTYIQRIRVKLRCRTRRELIEAANRMDLNQNGHDNGSAPAEHIVR